MHCLCSPLALPVTAVCRLAASAVSAMYFAVWGIYLQAASILILSRVHDYAATAGRAVGLVMCYGGFGTVCFFAVMDGEIPSVGVACAVELIAVVAVIKIGLVSIPSPPLPPPPGSPQVRLLLIMRLWNGLDMS